MGNFFSKPLNDLFYISTMNTGQSQGKLVGDRIQTMLLYFNLLLENRIMPSVIFFQEAVPLEYLPGIFECKVTVNKNGIKAAVAWNMDEFEELPIHIPFFCKIISERFCAVLLRHRASKLKFLFVSLHGPYIGLSDIAKKRKRNKFLKFLRRLIDPETRIILAGDHNVTFNTTDIAANPHYKFYSSPPSERRAADRMIDYFLTDKNTNLTQIMNIFHEFFEQGITNQLKNFDHDLISASVNALPNSQHSGKTFFIFHISITKGCS